MEKRNLSSLVLRVLSSLVIVPVVLAAIYFGDPYFNLLLIAVGAMWCWEWSTMVPNKNQALYAIVYTIAMVHSIFLPPSILWLLIVVTCGALVAYKARKEQHPRLLLLGVPYIALGMGALMWIYASMGAIVTLWVVLAVWSVDVGGYVFGCTLKGPKLAPKISPKKTWSGLIGGMLLSTAVCGAYAYLFGATSADLMKIMAAAAGIALIAQIGDLCESSIKRYLGIKDASNLIPGHGGVFDRVDGLVFAAPVFYIACIVMLMF